MYTRLEDLPETQTSVEDVENPSEPCICSCKAPALKNENTIVAGETATIQLSVNYDINGQLPSDNS